jgi:virulence factor Mce-like protein
MSDAEQTRGPLGQARPSSGGVWSARNGDLDAARSALAEADRQGHGPAAACLGLLLEARGDPDAAQAAYRRADERGDGFGALRLGLLMAAREDWDAANQAWQRAEARGERPEGPELVQLLAGGEGIAPSRPQPWWANKVLIGAVTVLILLVAVVIAFNANAGLPFVPVRTLHIDLLDGSDLVTGNDVLENGSRIGQVSSMRPIRLANGMPAAQVTVALSTTNGRLPIDSTAEVLSRSALGLKYLNLVPGTAQRVFANGATMPLSQTTNPVRFDQLLSQYNPPTRAAVQQNLLASGHLLAGRGSALNDTLAALPRLLAYLRPVARYLAAPATRLTGFLRAVDGVTATVAPVAQTGVRLFAGLATTLDAIAASPRDLEQTIAESPATLTVGTRSLAAQQPFLVNLTALGHDLSPATAQLADGLPAIDPAIEAGTRTLGRTPPLDRELQGVMVALRRLATSPGTSVALNGLAATVGTLNPTVRYLGPFVTVCNDWNYWWTDLAGDLDEATNFGFAQRVLFNQGSTTQPNNIGMQGATAPANGGGPAVTPGFGGDQYNHTQAYGAAVDNHGNADCETGQRGYPLKLNHGDPQGRLFATDAHDPGNQGTTFTGAAHVPAGETFSRVPELGSAAPSFAGNQ